MAESDKIATVAETTLAKYAPSGVQDFALIKAENLDTSMLAGAEDPRDIFPIYKVPSGGGKFFQPPADSDLDPPSEIRGVPLVIQSTRVMWRSDDVNNTAPDCASRDRVRGFGAHRAGDPPQEHMCAGCPFDEWGTGKDGRGKRCKIKTPMFILPVDSVLPIGIVAPVTGEKALNQLRTSLFKAQVPFQRVILRLTLTPDKNRDGTPYSRIQIALDRDENKRLRVLTDDDLALMRSKIAAFSAALTPDAAVRAAAAETDNAETRSY